MGYQHVATKPGVCASSSAAGNAPGVRLHNRASDNDTRNNFIRRLTRTKREVRGPVCASQQSGT